MTLRETNEGRTSPQLEHISGDDLRFFLYRPSMHQILNSTHTKVLTFSLPELGGDSIKASLSTSTMASMTSAAPMGHSSGVIDPECPYDGNCIPVGEVRSGR